MAVIDDYNKAAHICANSKAKPEEKKAAMAEIHRIERAVRKEGTTFQRVKGTATTYEAVEGTPKAELQREYARRKQFDNTKPVGPNGETYRQLVARRLGVRV